jgi:putative ATP-binding cassette transporter
MKQLIPDRQRQKALVRRYWLTARQFWTGDQRRVAWLMTGSLLALVVAQLVVQYRLNVWNRDVFDALEKKDSAVVLYQSMLFAPLAAVSIAIAVSVVWCRMRLQRRWRAWLTE